MSTDAREDRLAAARKTLSKYQGRINELKTATPEALTPSSVPADTTQNLLPLPKDHSETRAQDTTRARKDSLSSSTTSTATNSSKFSLLSDSRNIQFDPVRGGVVADETNVLESALDYEEHDAGIGDGPFVTSAEKLNEENHHAGAAVREAAPSTAVITAEELGHINLMYNQICLQLEQKALLEEQLKCRIDDLSDELRNKDGEISRLKTLSVEFPQSTEASTSVAESTNSIDNRIKSETDKLVKSSNLQQARIQHLEKENHQNSVQTRAVVSNFESQLSDAFQQLKVAQDDSKFWQESSTDWEKKHAQLHESYSLKQKEGAEQTALYKEQQSELISLRQKLQVPTAGQQQELEHEAKHNDLLLKLEAAQTQVKALAQERMRMQNIVAEASSNEVILRAQIIDLQSRCSRTEAEKYAMYEQMLRQAIVSERQDEQAAVNDVDHYSAVIEQLSAALRDAEAKLVRIENEFNQLMRLHNSHVTNAAASKQSANNVVIPSPHAVTKFSPALLEDLLRSKFVRTTNENVELKMLLDDRDAQVELLRGECDTIIDYINIYQMQKLKLAERELLVTKLESQIKNQLQRSLEFINGAGNSLHALEVSVQQALASAQTVPLAVDPSSLKIAGPGAQSDKAINFERNETHASIFRAILDSIAQITGDLHRIRGDELEALAQVDVQRRIYHADDTDCDNVVANNNTQTPTTGERLNESSITKNNVNKQINSIKTPSSVKLNSGLNGKFSNRNQQNISSGHAHPVSGGSSMCSINNAVVAYDGPVLSI